MSLVNQNLIEKIKKVIPQLSLEFYKGQQGKFLEYNPSINNFLGKIGILGGSSIYSGAPFFAGKSSLLIVIYSFLVLL